MNQQELKNTLGRKRHGCDVEAYIENEDTSPIFMQGEAASILKRFPAGSIDVCVTSPPYWGQRQYSADGIGLEGTFDEYLENLLTVFGEVHRVLKPTGSFWLNIGDTYERKQLMGMPWRVAIAMMDQQGWILRNDVIWYKLKGAPDSSKDKLRNIHEHVFHFVKQRKGYFYDVDAIRNAPKKASVKNGAVVTATGVSGVKYRRQIERSADLTNSEKESALAALDEMLSQVAEGKYSDFRMVIRGKQRATHSSSTKVSGRAKELRDRGYYFLRYHPKGSKPSDVWEILPEDTQKRVKHFAPFPADLCRLPIQATCPSDGIVLDPFCGTGTAMLVAGQAGRKSIGIDLGADYLEIAKQRCSEIF